MIPSFSFCYARGTTESCVPQQSIQNDCSIFTGLVSVYGSEVTSITFDKILELFHLEFPSFRLQADTNASFNKNSHNDGSNSDDTTISTLIQYGITRLNLSEPYTKIIARPTDPSSHRAGLDFDVSARSIIAVALMVLCILVGIYIIGRYLYTQRQISHYYDDRFDANVKKHHTESKKLRWTMFGKKDETDITETSSSSNSSSSSVSSWDTGARDGNVHVLRKVRALCNPTRRNQRRQRPRPESMEFTLSGGVSSMMANDSIYIVESDDEEDDDEYNGNLEGYPQRSYASESQLVYDDDNNGRYHFDPLCIASSSLSQSTNMMYES
jgi:hypothetical protein